jgi:hypothetical protein
MSDVRLSSSRPHDIAKLRFEVPTAGDSGEVRGTDLLTTVSLRGFIPEYGGHMFFRNSD